MVNRANGRIADALRNTYAAKAITAEGRLLDGVFAVVLMVQPKVGDGVDLYVDGQLTQTLIEAVLPNRMLKLRVIGKLA